VEVRNARASDVPEMIRLLWDDEQGRQRESLSPEDITAYQTAFREVENDPSSQLFVAIHGRTVIGCLQLTVIPGLSYRGARRSLVEDVRVAQSFRGRGIGGLLLTHAETEAIALGCKLTELFVHSDRDDAHRFYAQAGYAGVHRGFRKALGSASDE
tara:strand:- start:153 stop:620 length:468 start_codon:yes stop_codon:yes gene_type:complete